MGEEKAGIVEISAMLVALKDVAVAVAQVLKDGKVDLSDLGALMGLIAKMNEIVVAVKGADQIPKEVGDLSAEEAAALVAQVFALIAEVKAV